MNMIKGLIGVAISTTGEPKRIGVLQRCVEGWRAALPLGSVLVVTVDGSEADAARVRSALSSGYGMYLRVGQIDPGWGTGPVDRLMGSERLGVAVNKNTGIEALMDAGVEHLFLSDDDCWPLFSQSLDKHTKSSLNHSMVCWGPSRLEPAQAGPGYAVWNWPRGVMLYVGASVVDRVGGMVEEFGPGGHEHAEWSQRIYNAGLTPSPFCSPASYAEHGTSGKATRASALWHIEDMPQPGEPRHVFAARKRKHTSVVRGREDWARIDKVMARQEGSSTYVPYSAHANGRASATLCEINRAEEPETHEH